MTDLPLITVVTPSFNQARFLETTIRSVLGQLYQRLEYLIFDGGSSDGSAEIIRRYAPQLSYWQSQPDGGQAAAINAGFARSSGDLLCWLNSDDFFLPGTLHRIAAQFSGRTAEPLLCYGSCLFFEDQGKHAKVVRPQAHDSAGLRLSAYVIQPSAFWTRALWEKTGPLDAELSFAFDWDWFIRASAAGEFETCEEILSAYRLHAAHKSGSGGEKRRREILEVVRRHGAPQQVAAYEFAARNWAAHERRRALHDTLERRGIPAAGLWTRLFSAGSNAAPPGVTAEDLRRCAGMLRGS
ncbi:MAG TPA: glycosyltransferase family 2 protein [Chthoniobacteraceae bacterium]|jgi:glycosyltransferase involved in cell wall biosynthesis